MGYSLVIEAPFFEGSHFSKGYYIYLFRVSDKLTTVLITIRRGYEVFPREGTRCSTRLPLGDLASVYTEKKEMSENQFCNDGNLYADSIAARNP